MLREVERRIQQTEAKNAESPLPDYERPGIGVPERFDDHAKLMFDLQHLAFQGDITRVTTFMYGGEQRARMYPEIGLNESHHAMSHHGDNPGEPGEVHQAVHLARASCSPISSRRCGTRPTATATCSITRC